MRWKSCFNKAGKWWWCSNVLASLPDVTGHEVVCVCVNCVLLCCLHYHDLKSWGYETIYKMIPYKLRSSKESVLLEIHFLKLYSVSSLLINIKKIKCKIKQIYNQIFNPRLHRYYWYFLWYQKSYQVLYTRVVLKIKNPKYWQPYPWWKYYKAIETARQSSVFKDK